MKKNSGKKGGYRCPLKRVAVLFNAEIEMEKIFWFTVPQQNGNQSFFVMDKDIVKLKPPLAKNGWVWWAAEAV